jgi:tetratricopeptide (TPR) repeat protein
MSGKRGGRSVRVALGICLLLTSVITGLTAAGERDQEIQHIRDLIETDRFAEADSLGRVLLAEIDAADSSESLEAAAVLDLIWRGALESGTESIRLAERAVEIRKNIQGPEHGDVAMSMYHLAATMSFAGDYESVVETVDGAVEIAERALGPEHPNLAKILIWKGRFLASGGNTDEARPYYERALAIQEKVLGPEHKDTIKTLRWFAYFHYNTAEYDTAREMSERAVTLHKKVFPPNSLDLAHTLSSGVPSSLPVIGDKSSDATGSARPFLCHYQAGLSSSGSRPLMPHRGLNHLSHSTPYRGSPHQVLRL